MCATESVIVVALYAHILTFNYNKEALKFGVYKVQLHWQINIAKNNSSLQQGFLSLTKTNTILISCR